MNKENILEAFIFGIAHSDPDSKFEFRTIAKSNDSELINAIKSGQRSLLTKFKIKTFSCSICNGDYEMCMHEEGETYNEKICAPLMAEGGVERVWVIPRATNSRAHVTDMLLVNKVEKAKRFEWHAYPHQGGKQRLENLNKSLNKGWIDKNAASHFEKLFNVTSEGIFSYPPNPELILRAGYRIDFETSTRILKEEEILSHVSNVNKEDLYIRLGFRPDSERYIKLSIDGIEYLYDKFDRILIPYKETMDFLISHMKGGNLYWIRPKKDDIKKYVETRKKAITKFLAGKSEPYRLVDRSEEFLSKIEDHYTMKFVILNIDIKGSTKLSQSLSDQDNATIIQLFLKEIALIIDNYHGFVLKNVGDGIISYFPVPTFWGMDDNALDCAMAMKLVIENGINEILSRNKVRLEFRIGIDTGEAIVTTIGDESMKQHKDLIGETINICTKIQSIADTNQIVIGQQFWKNLGTHRRRFFDEIKPSKWDYKDKTGNVYKIFGLKKNYII